jgi:tetrahydromethanopterin S-methyltransferase subunit G
MTEREEAIKQIKERMDKITKECDKEILYSTFSPLIPLFEEWKRILKYGKPTPTLTNITEAEKPKRIEKLEKKITYIKGLGDGQFYQEDYDTREFGDKINEMIDRINGEE